MIKIGEKGKTTYVFEWKCFTVPALIKSLVKRGHKKYSRKLHYYITADVTFADTPVLHLFFVKRSKNGVWNGLITTNTVLDFLKLTEFIPKDGLWKFLRNVKDCWD